MPTQQYRVVLDTNQILAAGSRWLDGSREIGTANISRRILISVACTHTGLYSDKIVGEYTEKLVKKRHNTDRIVKFIALILGAFTTVDVVTKVAPVRPSDLDDEVFLLCAIDGNADYLVSDDRDLLDLAAAYARPIIGKSNALVGVLGA